MSERIILQDLIDLLSERKSITKKDTEAFLRELIALISESIETDEVVKIKDFGSFKLVKVNSRKSVNVNTGEAIEIPAHYKVSFTPDKTLRERINAPFAHFESVVLEDGVTFDNAESVAEEIIANIEDAGVHDDVLTEDIVSETNVENSVEVEEVVVIEENPQDQIEDTIEDEVPSDVSSEVIKIIESASDNIVIENAGLSTIDEEVTADREEAVVNEESSAIDDIVEEENSHLEDIGASVVDIVEEPVAEEISEKTIDDEEPIGQDDVISEEEISAQTELEIENQVDNGIVAEQVALQYEDENLYEKSSKKKIFIGIIAVLLIALVAVGWLYKDTIKKYVDDKGIFGSKRVTVVSYPATDKNAVLPADSLSNIQGSDSIAIDSQKLQPVTTIKISYGDTMRKLGLEHYGHKVFWVYIYEENKSVIKDPNNVPIGTELVIPPVSKYGIDANNTESIERAKKLEAELFSRF